MSFLAVRHCPQDPFPKPCYLFALVAGDLVVKEDAFTTSSGRNVVLRIYTQPANINQVRTHQLKGLRCGWVWMGGWVVQVV